jgi:DNA-binding transcriptional ArsR family regulator
MPFNMSNYTNKEAQLAQFAKALGHPARVAIISLLLKKQACICGDIVDELPLSQSTVSQHLKELKEAGIIKGEIDGVKTCYCIDETNWSKMSVLFNKMFDSITIAKKCC